MSKIAAIHALEILDSRGIPTIQARVVLSDGSQGIASVPSGASTGEHESHEIRDGDKRRYMGKGVKIALEHIERIIAPELKGLNALHQEEVDQLLISIDGTPQRSHLGANALLAVSLAVARAGANHLKMPLYRYMGGSLAHLLPVPMVNVLNGGCHADNPLDMQEFMIRPVGARSFGEAMRWSSEIYHQLKQILAEHKQSISVGDEGGFAPQIASAEEALDLLVSAIERAGYEPGQQVTLAMDCAASELFNERSLMYEEPKKQERLQSGCTRSPEEMIDYLESLVRRYPIDSIEDGLDQNGWDDWISLNKRLGSKIQIVGDDLFVTHTAMIRRGISTAAANAVLIKPNQIGTLSETFAAIRLAQTHGWKVVISHRSGETEDSFIADLAVATSAGQIKAGAPSRSERVAKYNRLLNIEEELGSAARYAGVKL